MQPHIPLDPPTPEAPSADTTPKPKTKWLWVLRDVVIVGVATYIGSRLVGFTSHGLSDAKLMEALSEAFILFMTLGFFVIAFFVRENRARHFLTVATMIWFIGSLPNIIFFHASLTQALTLWLATAPLIAFAMLVGGSAGCALFKSKTKRNTDAT